MPAIYTFIHIHQLILIILIGICVNGGRKKHDFKDSILPSQSISQEPAQKPLLQDEPEFSNTYELFRLPTFGWYGTRHKSYRDYLFNQISQVNNTSSHNQVVSNNCGASEIDKTLDSSKTTPYSWEYNSLANKILETHSSEKYSTNHCSFYPYSNNFLDLFSNGKDDHDMVSSEESSQESSEDFINNQDHKPYALSDSFEINKLDLNYESTDFCSKYLPLSPENDTIVFELQLRKDFLNEIPDNLEQILSGINEYRRVEYLLDEYIILFLVLRVFEKLRRIVLIEYIKNNDINKAMKLFKGHYKETKALILRISCPYLRSLPDSIFKHLEFVSKITLIGVDKEINISALSLIKRIYKLELEFISFNESQIDTINSIKELKELRISGSQSAINLAKINFKNTIDHISCIRFNECEIDNGLLKNLASLFLLKNICQISLENCFSNTDILQSSWDALFNLRISKINISSFAKAFYGLLEYVNTGDKTKNRLENLKSLNVSNIKVNSDQIITIFDRSSNLIEFEASKSPNLEPKFIFLPLRTYPIKTLKLIDCNITSIAWIKNIKSLISLDLSHNPLILDLYLNLRSFGEIISASIEKISLCNCSFNIYQLIFAITLFRNCKVISLDNNNSSIESVSNHQYMELDQLYFVKEAIVIKSTGYISVNNIEESINLINLTFLSLNNCQIDSPFIFDYLKNSTQLSYLNLSNNKFSNISLFNPNNITIKHLQDLHGWNSYLTLKNSTQLIYLDFSKDEPTNISMTLLDKNILQWSNLKYFCAENTSLIVNLEHLLKHCCKLSELKILGSANIYGNFIKNHTIKSLSFSLNSKTQFFLPKMKKLNSLIIDIGENSVQNFLEDNYSKLSADLKWLEFVGNFPTCSFELDKTLIAKIMFRLYCHNNSYIYVQYLPKYISYISEHNISAFKLKLHKMSVSFENGFKYRSVKKNKIHNPND